MKSNSSRAKAGNSHAPKAKAKKPTRHTDVSTLPEDLRKLIRKMLTEGATYEDTFDSVNERNDHEVTLRAIQNYYRSDLKLQQARIRHRLKVAKGLKEALRESEGSQKELAEAALLTGLLGLTRKGSQFDVPDAVRENAQRENIQLKRKTFRLKSGKANMDQKMAETRLEVERTKLEMVQHKVAELKQALENAGKRQKLGPETIQKIREIYGLVSDSPPAKPGSEAATTAA